MTATKREKIAIAQLMSHRMGYRREHVTPWMKLIGGQKVGIRQLKSIVRSTPSHIATRRPFLSKRHTDDADMLKSARASYYAESYAAHAEALVDMAGCLIRADALIKDTQDQGDMLLIEAFLGYGPNIPAPMMQVLSSQALTAWEADEDEGTRAAHKALEASYGYDMALEDLKAAHDTIDLKYALSLLRSFSDTIAQALCTGDDVAVQAVRLEQFARECAGWRRPPVWNTPPGQRSKRLVSWDGSCVLLDRLGVFETMTYADFASYVEAHSPARESR